MRVSENRWAAVYFRPIAGCVVLWVLLFAGHVQAQQMSFCERVNTDGTAVNPSSYFTVAKEGGFLHVLVNVGHALGSDHVIYDIYHVDEKSGKDVFENSVRLNTKAEWTWFEKEITFYKNGDYKIYVYDQRDRLLSAGKVKIILP